MNSIWPWFYLLLVNMYNSKFIFKTFSTFFFFQPSLFTDDLTPTLTNTLSSLIWKFSLNFNLVSVFYNSSRLSSPKASVHWFNLIYYCLFLMVQALWHVLGVIAAQKNQYPSSQKIYFPIIWLCNTVIVINPSWTFTIHI